MKVLVGCEYSGTVRDAFLRRGHDAISCDLLPTDASGPHYQGDVFGLLLLESFDLAIFFPPCTHVCGSGLHWNKRVPGRAEKTEEAISFFKSLLACGVPRIALENPIGCLSTRVRKPDQIIQPWQFGHPESKATCLWLDNLPPSYQQTYYRNPPPGSGKTRHPRGQNKLGPSPDRWKIRSKTYQGIAEAMAEQWGNL